MEVEAIPKPAFASCDETSLKLKCEYEVSEGQLLFLQYKEPHEDWSKAREIAMDTEATIKIGDVVDLKPGTAYFVRFALKKLDNDERVFGPETVFDTKPIDCTPKRKRCIIS